MYALWRIRKRRYQGVYRMSVVAIILARGGSKTIPLKNIEVMAGKPLIWYSIDCCLRTPLINHVVVSTDNILIKEDVKHHFKDRVEVVDRSAESATNDATSESAIFDTLDRIGEFDHVCLVQCTSPLTDPQDLDNLIKQITEEGKDSAGFYVEDYGYFYEDDLTIPRIPRQLMTPKKRETGNAWCFRISGFYKHKSRLFGNIGIVKIDKPKDLEIDEWEDIQIASSLLNYRKLMAAEDQIIYVDIDHTLFESSLPHYNVRREISRMVELINFLYEKNHIILWTARGSVTGIDQWRKTKEQIEYYKIKHHDLRVGKPMYSFWIDDKAIVA
jgi:N-acylneuraminate cytidylyltransferase